MYFCALDNHKSGKLDSTFQTLFSRIQKFINSILAENIIGLRLLDLSIS